MLRAFMARVLGGKSNKREASLFMFLICACWVTALIVAVFMEKDVASIAGMIGTVTIASIGGVLGTTITHHLRRPDQGEGE